mgnify:CR=1 FL=1
MLLVLVGLPGAGELRGRRRAAQAPGWREVKDTLKAIPYSTAQNATRRCVVTETQTCPTPTCFPTLPASRRLGPTRCAGKTYLARRLVARGNWRHVSQDELGSRRACEEECVRALRQGWNVVVDRWARVRRAPAKGPDITACGAVA